MLCFVIRDELNGRHWKVKYFADLLGVQVGVVSRWLHTNPEKRMTPMPSTVIQIADLLGIDRMQALRDAGYLPHMDLERPDSPHADQIEAANRRLQRILADMPEQHWPIAAYLLGTFLDQLWQLVGRTDPLS